VFGVHALKLKSKAIYSDCMNHIPFPIF